MPDIKHPSEILSNIKSLRQDMASNLPDYRVMDRMAKMLERLENGDKLGIKELSVEFNCATKTIQRDLAIRLPELITKVGLHYSLEKEGRFYKLVNNSEVKRSFSDLLVIDTLERLAEGVSSEFALKAKKALGRLKDDENPLYIQVHMEDITDKVNEVAQLQTAIQKKLIVLFKFLSGDRHKSVEAKPLQLLNFDGFWYLLAIDTKDDIIKKYYLKDISSVAVDSKKFHIPKGVTEKLDQAINIWFDPNSESYEVRLYADPSIAKYLTRRKMAKSQRIVSTDKDGGVEISVMATGRWEIVRLVLHWMPNLIVLSPEHLKEEISEMVDEFVEKMQTISE